MMMEAAVGWTKAMDKMCNEYFLILKGGGGVVKGGNGYDAQQVHLL
jgi:hypothetical protein